MPITPPACQKCGATLVERKGQYGAFYGCPNYKSDGSGCKGSIWKPLGEKANVSDTVLIMDEFKHLNDRIDSLAEYLVKKLGA